MSRIATRYWPTLPGRPPSPALLAGDGTALAHYLKDLDARRTSEGNPFNNRKHLASRYTDGLRALFTTWITAPQPDIDVLVSAVLDGAINYLSSNATEFAAEAKTVLELGEQYPGDAGVLAALLLNRITLAPGEGIHLAAGNLHAYLRGVGLEVSEVRCVRVARLDAHAR